MADANSSNANRVKGNDIDVDGDGAIDQAENATTVKGNDIDSNGDGRVDEADWSRDAGHLGNAPPWDYDLNVMPPEAGIASSMDGTATTISFEKTYNDPVVIALERRPAGTYWSGTADAQYIQISNVGSNSFDLELREFNGDGAINTVDVSWAVFERGIYKVGNVLFEVDYTNGINTFEAIPLEADFSKPSIMHDVQTVNNPSGTWSRIRNPGPDSFDLKTEGYDGTGERVGWVAAEQVEDSLGGIEVTQTPEYDVTDAFQSASFSRPYDQPPAVFAESTTFNGANEAYAMARGIGTDGFEVAMEEPASEDGAHGAAETIGFMYFPQGVVGEQNNADTLQGKTPSEISSSSVEASQTNDGSDISEYGHAPSAGTTTVCNISGSGVLVGGQSQLDYDNGSAQLEITVDGGTTFTAPYREVYHGGASSTHYLASIPNIRFDSSLKIVSNAGSTSYYATTSAWIKQ